VIQGRCTLWANESQFFSIILLSLFFLFCNYHNISLVWTRVYATSNWNNIADWLTFSRLLCITVIVVKSEIFLNIPGCGFLISVLPFFFLNVRILNSLHRVWRICFFICVISISFFNMEKNCNQKIIYITKWIKEFWNVFNTCLRVRLLYRAKCTGRVVASSIINAERHRLGKQNCEQCGCLTVLQLSYLNCRVAVAR
jgi:hypothetical protein